MAEQGHRDDGPVTAPGHANPRLAVETWESLFRAQVTIMRRLQSDPVWDGLTLREYDVLFSLTKGPDEGMRLRDLNVYILLSQPSLSRMVDRLATRGLVERTSAPDDARAIATYVGGALDDDELATLGGLLERLRAAQTEIPDAVPDARRP